MIFDWHKGKVFISDRCRRKAVKSEKIFFTQQVCVCVATQTLRYAQNTHYQGKDVELAWKDSNGVSVFGPNNLIWKVTTPNTVNATADTTDKNVFTFTSFPGSTDPIDDVATVSLTYISGTKELSAKERSIKVSNKPAMPQGEYQIIKADEDQDPIVNYLDKNTIAEISEQTAFKLVAEDQYGDTYDKTPLFTVISSKGLFTIATTAFPTVDGSFDISPGISLTVGEDDTIKVYVTKDHYFEFTVKYVQGD